MMNLGTSLVIKFMSKILPFVVGWFYKPERLAEKVEVSINPQDEGVYIDAGQGSSARMWIKVTNFTPFPVEIDRLFGELSLGNKIANYSYLHRKIIQPSKSELLLVETTLSGSQAALVKLQKETKEVSLTINAYFNCKITNFCIMQKYIKSKNIELVNAN